MVGWVGDAYLLVQAGRECVHLSVLFLHHVDHVGEPATVVLQVIGGAGHHTVKLPEHSVEIGARDYCSGHGHPQLVRSGLDS